MPSRRGTKAENGTKRIPFEITLRHEGRPDVTAGTAQANRFPTTVLYSNCR